MRSHNFSLMSRLLTLAAALALVAAACGGDGEEEAQGADVQAFCDAAVEGEAAVIASEGGGGDQVEPLVDRVAETAPDELADEVGVIVAGVREAIETDDSSNLDSPEFREADEAVDLYLLANCGFEQTEVTAVEYEFQGVPETLQAGRIALDFVNGGAQVHEMGIVRIDEGVDLSVEELLDLPEKESDKLLTFVGSMVSPPGESDAQVLDLEPGRYGFACFIPEGATSLEQLEEGGEDLGPPHFTLGMFGEFTVSA
ncbi:MAG: hypothetical protein ACRDH6_08435 [Actinomycetota bacterium]